MLRTVTHRLGVLVPAALLAATFLASPAWRPPARAQGAACVVPPGPDAVTNYNKIVACFKSGGTVTLQAGSYALAHHIYMPPQTKMTGATDGASVITYSGSGNTVFLLKDGDSLDHVHIDAGGALTVKNSAIVKISGDGNSVTDTEVYDRTDSPIHVTGIYFIGQAMTHNTVERADIHDVFNGVIFRKGQNDPAQNVLADSKVEHTQCDAVNLAGAGTVRHDTITEVGFDCGNKIPAAGIYALNNQEGAVITGNTVSDSCGNLLDIVNSKAFRIENNSFTGPGFTEGGKYPACRGNGASLVNVQGSTISGNTIVATDRNPVPAAVVGDEWAGNFAARARLSHPLIALKLVYAPRYGDVQSTGNVFENNTFSASCSAGGCTGLGLFVGKETGSNTFRDNHLAASNVPSVRCGQNSYSANDDDKAHGGGGNDGC
jgi:hypothetical protein